MAPLEEELATIEAIYPGSINQINANIVELTVPNFECFKLRISFPDSYPDQHSQPSILIASSTRQIDKQNQKGLLDFFSETLSLVLQPDEVCLFDFVSELDVKLPEYLASNPESAEPDSSETDPAADSKLHESWSISDPITDRHSTFIAYAHLVTSESQLTQLLHAIRSDRKIAKASHAMCAWRIKLDGGSATQDFDDDGETAAGSRLLHLMTLMDVWDCLVVDVRWFGGVHIGPDRFKHINSSARQALVKGGFGTKS